MGILDQVSVEKLDGLLDKRPLHRDKKGVIYFTVEHHPIVSLGAYEVVIRGKSFYFWRLKDAVDFFNESK